MEKIKSTISANILALFGWISLLPFFWVIHLNYINWHKANSGEIRFWSVLLFIMVCANIIQFLVSTTFIEFIGKKEFNKSPFQTFFSRFYNIFFFGGLTLWSLPFMLVVFLLAISVMH